MTRTFFSEELGTVEAVQWLGDQPSYDALTDMMGARYGSPPAFLSIQTRNGATEPAYPGDWIVQYPDPDLTYAVIVDSIFRSLFKRVP